MGFAPSRDEAAVFYGADDWRFMLERKIHACLRASSRAEPWACRSISESSNGYERQLNDLKSMRQINLQNLNAKVISFNSRNFTDLFIFNIFYRHPSGRNRVPAELVKLKKCCALLRTKRDPSVTAPIITVRYRRAIMIQWRSDREEILRIGPGLTLLALQVLYLALQGLHFALQLRENIRQIRRYGILTAGGQTIQSIIRQGICMSDYGRAANSQRHE
jgi:hypothetical protein